jgi:hypothetical protein
VPGRQASQIVAAHPGSVRSPRVPPLIRAARNFTCYFLLMSKGERKSYKKVTECAASKVECDLWTSYIRHSLFDTLSSLNGCNELER